MFKEIPEGYIEKEFTFSIPSKIKPVRVDVYLTNSIVNTTRNRVQRAIDMGYVFVNDKVTKASRKLQGGDFVKCTLIKLPPLELIPQDIPVPVIYEDDYLLIVNKPAGMVTHPGFGNRDHTLINAVLWHLGVRENIEVELQDDDDEDNEEISSEDEGKVFASDAVRPGLVHRLDKDTTGLLIISKETSILTKMQRMFAERTVNKEYFALVWGDVKENSGTITGDIGRSPRNRKKFEVLAKGGKPSITDFEVLERFGYLTLLKVHLRTGRTHQIRVHFSHNKHPLFGDPLYGGDTVICGGHIRRRKLFYEKLLAQINRQMLHAGNIGFYHPVTGDYVSFTSDLPSDMISIIRQLREFEAKQDEII